MGRARVTAVVETTEALSPDFVLRVVLPDALPERLRAIEWFSPSVQAHEWTDGEDRPRMVVQALVVESDGRVIVVDTCIGDDKPRRNEAFRLRSGFAERLQAAGFHPDAVDVVVCTHLHFDHVGWNTRLDNGRWVPTFSRARHLIGRREWAPYADQPADALRDHLQDSVLPLFEAGLVDLVDLPHAVTSEVTIEATPGHTPGHASVCIRSGGAEAWITGDMIHHPCQIAHPAWASPADSDRDAAVATRSEMLKAWSESRALVIGTHFAPPTAGRVDRVVGGFRFLGEPGVEDAD